MAVSYGKDWIRRWAGRRRPRESLSGDTYTVMQAPDPGPGDAPVQLSSDDITAFLDDEIDVFSPERARWVAEEASGRTGERYVPVRLRDGAAVETIIYDHDCFISMTDPVYVQSRR